MTVANDGGAAEDNALARNDTEPARNDTELARKDAEWAAKADRTGSGHPAPGLGGSSGISGAGGGTSTYRTPKHLRTSGGPRLRGRGVLAVFGLLGMLLTVGIMVFLFLRVLDGLSADDDPAVPAVPAIPAIPGGAGLDPQGATASADAAACSQELETIRVAVQTYEVLHGGAPGSLAELIAQGFLVEPTEGFSHEIAGDGTIEPIGSCAPG